MTTYTVLTMNSGLQLTPNSEEYVGCFVVYHQVYIKAS